MAEEKEEQPTADRAAEPVITINYIKSNHFRVIHADGFQGGPTPNGEGLQFVAYNDRVPIPLQTTHVFNSATGAVGELKNVVAKLDIVREVEAEMIMSHRTAHALYEWLKLQMGMLEEAAAKAKEKEAAK